MTTKQKPISNILAQAMEYHERGRLDEAEALYQEILRKNTDDSDALHLLGVVELQRGNPIRAEGLIARAVQLRSDHVLAHCHLGNALQELHRYEEALASYDRALAIKSGFADAHNNRGNALNSLARHDEALASYERALAINPAYGDAYCNRSNVLRRLKRYSEALESAERALCLNPDFAEAHHSRANALWSLGRHAEALAGYGRAVWAKPNYAEAYSSRADALRQVNFHEDALADYDRALTIKPDDPDVLTNRGRILYELHRYEEAVASYDRALAIAPDYADVLSSRGEALKEQGKLKEAIRCHEQAVVLKPTLTAAYSNLLLCLHYSTEPCNAHLFDVAVRFGAAFRASGERVSFTNEPIPNRRLRIGYVSADFRTHPVGHFLSRILPAHNRADTMIVCYTNGANEDSVTAHLRRASDGWRSIVGLSDAAAAEMIRRDCIDILVDLSGHTDRNRLSLFGLRSAPIQVSYLGYFGTTGLPEMDYVLADNFVVSKDEERFFTESIWRLPGSYLCFAPPTLGVQLKPRSMAPGAPTVFGCFNSRAKISDSTIALWAKILGGAVNSHLILKTFGLGDETARHDMRERFRAFGIPDDRLILEGPSNRAELLSCYNRIDVALDPMPFGGGTTTAEALWMGSPVVTLRGDRWVGRVSESILSTIGLSELVASTPDEYVAIANNLAADPFRLATLRSGLRSQVEGSALCDGRGFTQDLERAYRGMWHKWCRERGETEPTP